ncbi:ABC-type antimicrobial peptide transport system permease subunit [Pedobacter cryoconitis]|uniref:ABC transporter permease n=1 Tax=Pedobacter cryoconitis TaxID=188932 RepID=UPI00161961E5|nr:ABC transporter permease [Pedobacter cryoconitis]MBB6269830.1 ABC-type antimicrobial peptide transport system permease subunit [Pedobacter cryoconitis]
MFKLNLKIALRNLWRNKTSSFINISGLAIGLASCLLLLLYVSYEWSYDNQGKDASYVYKVLTNYLDINKRIEGTGENTGNMAGPKLKEDYPAVQAMSRYEWGGPKLIANGTKSFKKRGRFADADILNIFEYTFLSGDRKTALDAPNNVIVTASTAQTLFGTTDVLNKTVRFDNKLSLKITGVIKDLPGNTSVYFDFLMPWSLYETQFDWVKSPSWTNYNWETIIKLDPSTDIAQFNSAIKGMMEKNHPHSRAFIFAYPLNKLHLNSTFINGKSSGGKIEQVRLFMGLAIGILLIACVNFMNMATAKSERRAKEVGIKKTIGATRGSLIIQFLMESLVLTFCSAVMAIVLIELTLPLFNNLLGITLAISYSNFYVWTGLVAVVILTGLIAGSYPAFYLSSFNPIQILKKKGSKNNGQFISLRQILVIGQFSFAVILIIATTVIYQQIRFIKDRPVGYKVNELVEIEQDGNLYEKFDLLKTKLLQSGAVTALAQTSSSITRDGSSFIGMEWQGSTAADKLITFNQIATTYDFIKTTGVSLLEGREFSPHFASDSAAVMVNRSAVKRMNLTEPIGQTILYHGEKRTIVGVFDDFIWGSPVQSERPMVVAFNKGWGGRVIMHLNPANTTAANLASITRIIKEINPAYPVDINFTDRLYADKLNTQSILGVLSNLFGGLAIFISCLGLFGLTAYSAEQRTKEIGVRKVLGASVTSLMKLLSLSFLKMVMAAIIIGVPVADYIMSGWLKSFEFHTTINWLVIVLAAMGTLGIALVTVSFQAYKAAKTNPVQALKYE